MSVARSVRSHADAWETLYGPKGIGEECQVQFTKEFPDGHATSIRSLVLAAEEILKDKGSFEKGSKSRRLGQFHPRAFALLAKFGIDYAPKGIDRVQVFASKVQPTPGQCFSNAWRLMEGVRGKKKTSPLVYVEGMVAGVLTEPILHAWNSHSLTDQTAIDWTYYLGCEWNRYIGIPVTFEQHWDMCKLVHPRKPERLCSLLHRSCFPKVEEYLVRILKDRT